MDLLASLHLDALPEQQTRTSRPSVTEALTNNPDIKLGFDACCNCAARNVSVQCKRCRRVAYCSNKCRMEDANPPDDDETQQLGHGPVVCALLRLCNKDEDVDEGIDDHTDEASRDRVRSEFESYPATLANVLMDGPAYQDVITRQSQGSGNLTVHIVGASAGVELWGDYRANAASNDDTVDVYEAYAEALTDLVEMHKLKKIHLVFVGPDCPKKNIKKVKQLSCHDGGGGGEEEGRKFGNRKSPCLVLESHKANYDAHYLKNGPREGSSIFGSAADIVVFFNPGFTCPDYTWDEALSCIKAGVPFLVTTNTEMEAVADCQYLLEKNLIPALPPLISDIVKGDESGKKRRHGREEEDEEEDYGVFSSENPFAGMRVRQSGNMANDLFVKNRWMVGGLCGQGILLDLKEKSAKKQQQVNSAGGEKGGEKKQKKSKGNTKKCNPALI